MLMENIASINPKASALREQKVTPWEVEAADERGVDYDKLIEQFGTRKIDQSLLDRLENLTGRKPHRYLRRGLFFSHRDLGMILDRYSKNEPFFLYTGRGPSSDSMHIGHVIPFTFTKWLQDTFDVPLVIQLTDDEKFLFKNLTVDQVQQFARQNARDIIACGFDMSKTFIFSDLDYMGPAFYENVVKIAKCITISQSKATFGFAESDNVGMIHFPSIQAAPSFSSSFPQIFGDRRDIPALIPCAVDQDPYFRLTRDVASKLKYPKPALIHAKFIPSLLGAKTKMSASKEESVIHMNDDLLTVTNKIHKYAYSGEEAANTSHPEVEKRTTLDVSYQYLSYFLEDDVSLKNIHDDYESGQISSKELKDIAISELWKFMQKFQERRAKVTEEEISIFMDGNRSLRLSSRYNWIGQKKFVSPSMGFPLFSDELVQNIMLHLPATRAKELLHKNGQILPKLCQTEVELYQRVDQNFWILYVLDAEVVTESFLTSEECVKRVLELQLRQGKITDIVVVDKIKSPQR